jgi:hypothetical protein
MKRIAAIKKSPLAESLYRLVMGNTSPCCSSEEAKPSALTADAKAAGPKPIPPGFILLKGCKTMEEHELIVARHLEIFDGDISGRSRQLRGEEGLKAIGFEFRFVPCSKHKHICRSVVDYGREMDSTEISPANNLDSAQEDPKEKEVVKQVRFDFSSASEEIARVGWHSCMECATRLFHVENVVELQCRDDEGQASDAGKCDSLEENSLNGSSSGEASIDVVSEDVATTSNAVSSESDNAAASHAETGGCDERTSAACSSVAQNPQSDSTTDTIPTKPSPQTPTLITPQNRHDYISDGAHYELLSTLAQEAAHEIMRRTFDLQWVIICDDVAHGEEVRALVDVHHKLVLEEGENMEAMEELLGMHLSHHDEHEDEKKEREEPHVERTQSTREEQHSKSTLLIATGRGKVRAGIFSRFHLLTAGIEVGTAWHNVREARLRDMGVVIIDPNARGEQEGMETFKRSVRRLFSGIMDRVRGSTISLASLSRQDQQGHNKVDEPLPPMNHLASSIYILAHSASGGQLVRHLREDTSLLPSIRAIAFTDSTHNIQWCKDDPSLMDFLSTNNCIYLRSNDVRTSQSCVHVSSRGKDIACQCVNCTHNRKSAGVVANTDSFWEHRFGKIRTLWAGTGDHSLSNWAGHDHIWLHFDRHAAKDGSHERR